MVAESMVANMESLKAFIDALIQEEDSENKRPVKSPAELMEVRQAIEERFVPLAPPVVHADEDEDATMEWVRVLLKHVIDAADVNLAPMEAIPWF
jgi:hypothetical protein